MSGYITLMGAETVGNAARTINHAADTMNQASGNFEYAVQRLAVVLTEFNERFETLIERQKEALENHGNQ